MRTRTLLVLFLVLLASAACVPVADVEGAPVGVGNGIIR